MSKKKILAKKYKNKSVKKSPLSQSKVKIVRNLKEGWKSNGVLGALRAALIHTPKTPVSAQWHEWDIIEKKQRKNHPVAYFLLHDVPTYLRVQQMRISDVIWWLKYRTMKAHNHHTVFTDLTPGYHDFDAILLHASMAVLVDYVENSNHSGSGLGEKGLADYIDFYEGQLDPKNWAEWERKAGKKYKEQRIAGDTETVNDLKEILNIYRWWKNYRKIEHLALEKEQELFYGNLEFSFRDGRDHTKLVGEEKKRYLKEREIANSLNAKEQDLYNKDSEMLLRLIKVRQRLW